ncbi:MAG: hypothetical protein KQI35_05470 [Bacteroidetes bacterium]|nr:hypothetical protein [Bacteroidota bacterium]
MAHLMLIFLGISVAGFVFGLAAKARAIKNKSIRKSEIYAKVVTISLILMFVFVILYKFID